MLTLNNFSKNFNRKYHYYPTKYAIEGFDITYDQMGELVMGNYDKRLVVKCSELMATVFSTEDDKKKREGEKKPIKKKG